MKKRILSLSIAAAYGAKPALVTDIHRSAFPVVWPPREPEPMGRLVRVRWPSHASDELYDFNNFLGPNHDQLPHQQRQTGRSVW